MVDKEVKAARKDLDRLNRTGSARVQNERGDILDEQEEWRESGQSRAKKEIRQQRKKFDKERADAVRKGDETLRDLAKQGAAQLKEAARTDDQSAPTDQEPDAANGSPGQPSSTSPADTAAPGGPASPVQAGNAGPQASPSGITPSAEARSALPTVKLSPP